MKRNAMSGMDPKGQSFLQTKARVIRPFLCGQLFMTCKITRSTNTISRLKRFLKEIKITIWFILCRIFSRLYVSPQDMERHHCIVVVDDISLTFYIRDVKRDKNISPRFEPISSARPSSFPWQYNDGHVQHWVLLYMSGQFYRRHARFSLWPELPWTVGSR